MARTFPLLRKATKQLHSQNDHILSFLSGPIKFLTTILKKAIGSTTHRYLGLSASELAEGLAKIAVNDNNKKTVLILTFICKIITGQLPTMCLVLCKGNSAKFIMINLRKVTNWHFYNWRKFPDFLIIDIECYNFTVIKSNSHIYVTPYLNDAGCFAFFSTFLFGLDCFASVLCSTL